MFWRSEKLIGPWKPIAPTEVEANRNGQIQLCKAVGVLDYQVVLGAFRQIKALGAIEDAYSAPTCGRIALCRIDKRWPDSIAGTASLYIRGAAPHNVA